MDIEEYLTTLNIENRGEFKANKYVITLKDSEEFMKLFSQFESNKNLEQEDSGVIESDNTSIYYIDKENDMVINLSANFDSNEYKLILIQD